MKSNSSAGQAGLVVLLLMAVAATIGLIMSRNVMTDVQITRVQEESARAFAAAEAGIESELYSWQTGEEVSLSFENAEVETDREEIGNSQSFVTLTVEDGDFGVIWLTNHDEEKKINTTTRFFTPSSFTLCWEKQAAVEAVLFYKEDGTFKTKRWAFDAQASSRGNNFSSPLEGVDCGQKESFSEPVGASLSLPSSPAIPLFVVVKVYYSSTPLAASASGNFPVQGVRVTSTGKIVSGEEKIVSRRLQVIQTWDLPPLVFLEPLFSQGTVVSTGD
ncbi:hypothetical protein J7J95_01440 [bacterium]|nr:hypothetical protein [bacterium]